MEFGKVDLFIHKHMFTLEKNMHRQVKGSSTFIFFRESRISRLLLKLLILGCLFFFFYSSHLSISSTSDYLFFLLLFRILTSGLSCILHVPNNVRGAWLATFEKNRAEITLSPMYSTLPDWGCNFPERAAQHCQGHHLIPLYLHF